MKYLLFLILSAGVLASCSSPNKVNTERECQFACRNEAHHYVKKAPIGCECTL